MAGLHLIEALRAYEDALNSQPSDERREFYSSRSRSEFSWHEVYSELYFDPLDLDCLHRANWTAMRPKLFADIYITERNNLVIEVRPTFDSGFRYGGMTQLREGGDFRRFFIYTAAFNRPSNRVLYIRLGDLMGNLRFPHPWRTSHHEPLERHATGRHLLVLSVKAKLHQLSLYFDCYVTRELVEFGPHNLIDFRTPPRSLEKQTGLAQPRRHTHNYAYFQPEHWQPPRLRELIEGIDIATDYLYAFARDYLSQLPEGQRVLTLQQFIGGPHASRITQADVIELIEAATHPEYRRDELLKALATAPDFEQEFAGYGMLDFFCRQFSMDQPEGVCWLARHHPEVLTTLRLSTGMLVMLLQRPDIITDPSLFGRIDALLAAAVADVPLHELSLNSLKKSLDEEAISAGFVDFMALQGWSRRQAPQTFAATEALAVKMQLRTAQLEEEARTKQQAAKDKRKVAREAKKQATTGGSE